MDSYDYSEAYLEAIREANERESENKLHTLLLLLTYFPIFKTHIQEGQRIFPNIDNPVEILSNRIKYLKKNYQATELNRENYLDYYKSLTSSEFPDLLKKKILFLLDAIAQGEMTNAQIILDEILNEL
jgi:glutamate racemase